MINFTLQCTCTSNINNKFYKELHVHCIVWYGQYLQCYDYVQLKSTHCNVCQWTKEKRKDLKAVLNTRGKERKTICMCVSVNQRACQLVHQGHT